MDLPGHRDLSEVRSREALRFEFVDEQGWDTSCGYSALATLVRRYRCLDVTEADLLAQAGLDPKGGVTVTLGRLGTLARTLGFDVRAWRADYGHLVALVGASAPVLVHYDRPQGHFALVLQAGPDGLVAADPARGLELLTRQQFLDRWSGAVLEVLDLRNPRGADDLLKRAAARARGTQTLFERALARAP